MIPVSWHQLLIYRFSTDIERKEPQFRFLGKNEQFSRLARTYFPAGNCQLQSGRTGAGVTGTIREAQMRTSALITSTSVDVVGLPERMNTVNIHRKMEVPSHRSAFHK